MASFAVEVLGRFEESVPCRDVVYSSVPRDCTIRESRVYEVAGEGDRENVESFVENVLVDDVSQEWFVFDDAGESALSEYDQRIDVWLKSTVLDLEEDYLLDYCENHRDADGFRVDDLRILTRYYLDAVDDDVVEAVVRDIANPVIQDWTVSAHGPAN